MVDADGENQMLTEERSRFPWQEALYLLLGSGKAAKGCVVPTGLGKTSVIAIWFLTGLEKWMAAQPGKNGGFYLG